MSADVFGVVGGEVGHKWVGGRCSVSTAQFKGLSRLGVHFQPWGLTFSVSILRPLVLVGFCAGGFCQISFFPSSAGEKVRTALQRRPAEDQLLLVPRTQSPTRPVRDSGVGNLSWYVGSEVKSRQQCRRQEGNI